MRCAASPNATLLLPTTLPGGSDAPDSVGDAPATLASGQLQSVVNAAGSFTVSNVSLRTLGGGSLTVRAVPVVTRADAVRSGQDLVTAWQALMGEWTCDMAARLRAHAVAEGTAGSLPVPDIWHYVHIAHLYLQHELPEIVGSAYFNRLLPLQEPLPPRMRDAVMAAADVEILAPGQLDEAQIERANLALEEIARQLQQPAAQALVEGRLGALFAALHARARAESCG